MEGKRKQREEEEHRKHLEVAKEKQSGSIRQEDGESGESPAEEAEWRKRVEVQLHEKRVDEQMARAAQVESSKQATQDFA